MEGSEESPGVVKWNEVLSNMVSIIIRRYIDETKFAAYMAVSFIAFFHFLLVLFCTIVFVVVCFVSMLLFDFVNYVLLILCCVFLC